MNFYDVYYRKRGDKNAEIKVKSFCAETKESAKLIAKGIISSEYTIIEIKKG